MEQDGVYGKLIAIFAVLALIGGVWYYVAHKPGALAPTSPTSPTSSSPTSPSPTSPTPSPLSPQTPPSNNPNGISAAFFGLLINKRSDPYPSSAGLTFGSYRSLNSSINWFQIEPSCDGGANPTSNCFNWTNFDYWLGNASKYGQQIMYTLYDTPQWANGGQAQEYPPSDINPDGSGTDQDWVNFVTAVAEHVKSNGWHVTYWEIWNEPTVSNEWRGTSQQLVRMTADAHCIIKGKPGDEVTTSETCAQDWATVGLSGPIDPTSNISSPPPTNYKSPEDAPLWMNCFLKGESVSRGTCAGGVGVSGPGLQYVDAISYHSYLGAGLAPEAVIPLVQDMRAMMQTDGIENMPLFSTEGSWGGSGDTPGVTDPVAQAAFVARYLILQASFGTNEFYWFTWDSENSGYFWNNTWAEPNNTMNLAGTAWNQVDAWLVGATLGTCSQNGTTWTCPVSRPNGYEGEIIWNTAQPCTSTSCPTESYTPSANYIDVKNLAGATAQIMHDTVSISAEPILLEN